MSATPTYNRIIVFRQTNQLTENCLNEVKAFIVIISLSLDIDIIDTVNENIKVKEKL